MIKKCLVCKKEFKTFPYRVKLGYGNYCSSKCYGNSMIGKPAPHPFKKGNIPWNKDKEFPQVSGKNSNFWKGGKYQDKNGYWWILKKGHPRAQSNGYIKRCWLVAEKCLGRPVRKSEIIHHINNKSDDDRPKNLYLFSSISQHKKYHGNQYSKNKPKLQSNLLKIYL